MKIECTAQEAESLFNLDKLDRLREYLTIAREERDNLEKELFKVRNSFPGKSPDVGKLVKSILSLYRNNAAVAIADDIRYALNEFYPDQKIMQIKLIREVSNCGLKTAKDFIEGTTNYLPFDKDDDIPF